MNKNPLGPWLSLDLGVIWMIYWGTQLSITKISPKSALNMATRRPCGIHFGLRSGFGTWHEHHWWFIQLVQDHGCLVASYNEYRMGMYGTNGMILRMMYSLYHYIVVQLCMVHNVYNIYIYIMISLYISWYLCIYCILRLHSEFPAKLDCQRLNYHFFHMFSHSSGESTMVVLRPNSVRDCHINMPIWSI